VPVPFPTDDEADFSRPTRDEARDNARAFATAVAPEGGLTKLQEFVIRGLAQALTADLTELGDLARLELITPEAYAELNRRRDRAYRIRRVQTMVLLELLLHPLPDDVVERVEAFADELGVGDDCRDMLEATRHLSAGSTEAALADFMRNGYEVLQYERAGEAPAEDPGDYWASVLDPDLAARWAALEDSPGDSLGRKVWEFYKGRGFNFPGTPNSVSPRLAQHDFVHVLSDYGTTVESEIEVFALIARADEDPRSFSLLVAVLALFETGYLDRGLGAFRADPGHLSEAPPEMGTRLGNAIARGGEVAWRFHETSGIDLLAVDWFARADERLEDLQAEFGFTGPGAKSLEAKVAGSAGPFEPGGVTPAQLQWGRDMAAAEGRGYVDYGACLRPGEG
jgi:hypothetical protein